MNRDMEDVSKLRSRKEELTAPPPDAPYIFAGTMGGQNVYDCVTCGALVRESGMGAHGATHTLTAVGDLPDGQ